MIEATTLAKLWDQHSDRLLLIARSIGGPAEDAVQEAFVALATQPHLPDDPLAWLVTVARNRLLEWQRAGQRRSSREAVVGTRWFGRATQPDHRLDATDVAETLQRLPSPDREVIVMHLWGEMSFETIAKVVGGSRSTAHRSFQRGLAELKRKFDPEPTPRSATVSDVS